MDFLDDVKEVLTDYVKGGNVQAFVKTNYGPEIPIYTGSDGQASGGGVGDIIGLKAQIIIRDKSGKVISTYGEPAPTEPLKVAMLGMVVGTLAWVLWRAI